MLSKIFSAFFIGLMRYRLIALIGFSLLLGVLLVGATRLSVNEDIYSIFPEGEKFDRFSTVLDQSKVNQQLFLSFNYDEDEVYEQLDSLKLILDKRFGGSIGQLRYTHELNEREFITFVQQVSLAKTSDFTMLDSLLCDSRHVEHLLNEQSQRISGLGSLVLGSVIAYDPMNWTANDLSNLGMQAGNGELIVEEGLLLNKDKTKVFVLGELAFSPKETSQLVQLVDSLEAFKLEFANWGLDFFGPFEIAAANAKQVQKDTWITLWIGVIGIVILLVFVYRQLLAPILFVLPVVFAGVFGLGVVGFFEPNISAISLATSSVLLGIVLDYAFHFYGHYQDSGDLKETVQHVSSPLLLGSFTTVVAFFALTFTNSVVLEQFGRLALFTLLGAAVFVLTFFPLILSFLPKPTFRKESNRRIGLKNPRLVTRVITLALIVGSLYFLSKASEAQFDADLRTLSYHPQGLKSKELAVTGLQPDEQKKFYVLAHNSEKFSALENNQRIYEVLQENTASLSIQEIVSLSPYLVSNSDLDHAKGELSTKRETWLSNLTQAGSKVGFSSTAFDASYQLDQSNEEFQKRSLFWIDELGLDRLILDHGNSYLTSVVVDRSHLEEIKSHLLDQEGVEIIDLAEFSTLMLDQVREDFNYLLLFSALLVFATMLVVYGHLELALLGFFPMALSWIWILGASALLGIPFNFVNILIATFIFGLGDDFSVFTLDGLIRKYSTGSDVLNSYRKAIVLSGLTTIIGTGVLIFAKHPAIHSVAVISVLGISIILLVTLYIQPRLFIWSVSRRSEKLRSPLRLLWWLYSLGLFLYFFLGCVLLNLFLVLVLMPLPVKKDRKRKWLNYLVSKLARSTIFAGVHVRKRFIGFEHLDYSRPSIIVANHSSFLDILLTVMMHPKSIIFVKKWVYNSPVFGLFIRYAGYLFAEDGAEGNIDLVRKRMTEGYSVIIFPEGTRSKDGEIKRFHKGAFLLAKELNVDIQPVLLVGTHHVNPKNDLLINQGDLITHVLPRMNCRADESYVDFSKRVVQVMRREYILSKAQNLSQRHWNTVISRNYLYKNPVTEWYVRIKWRLEFNNFKEYERLLRESKKIYDIGCGLGYFSYYLHYCNPKKNIVGVDYDKDKIAIAQNGIFYSENLIFQTADIRNYEFSRADAFCFNDVLHYLKKEDQYKVLTRILPLLEEKGSILIRDGIKNDKKNHKNTELTEWFSTKVFKFNRADDELCFLNVSDFEQFAEDNNLMFSHVRNGKNTSNTLIILKKR